MLSAARRARLRRPAAHLQPGRLGGRAVGQRRPRGDPVPAPPRLDRPRRPSRSRPPPGTIRPTITGTDAAASTWAARGCARKDFPAGPRDGTRRRCEAAGPRVALPARLDRQPAVRDPRRRRRRARRARPAGARAARSSTTSCSPTARTSRGTPSSSRGSASARGSSSAGWGRRCPRGPGATRRRRRLRAAAAATRPGRPCVLDGGELEVEVGRGPARAPDRLGACPCSPGRAQRRVRSRSCMKPSKRLERIPPYLFAELERKIAAKRAAGVDVISLGIGDPDRPTPAARSSRRCRRRSAEPETHRTRPTAGARTSARRSRDFYARRFDVDARPRDARSSRRSAPRSAIFNLNLAFLDPGDVRAGRRPRLPGLHRRAAGSSAPSPCSCRSSPSAASCPTSTRSTTTSRERARLMFLNYPNNPTGAVVPDGFFEERRRVRRATTTSSSSTTTPTREIAFDGYRAPSFLATPGAKDVGIEVFSLSKGYNMTGWRCARDRRQRRGDRRPTGG